MPTPRRSTSGFTIMELLVSMSLILLLLFLTNILFQNTNQAVTRSIQTSKVIATARVINEQITDDANAMLGPDVSSTGGGYLVIIQRQITGVPMLDPQTLAEIPGNTIRSDQLVFIRSAEGLSSMTPQGTDSYRTNLEGQGGSVAKVYYGHAQRLRPDGSVPGTGASFQLGGNSAGLDRIGSNWIMARQAMLMNPPGLAGTDTSATNAYASSGVANVSGYTPANVSRGLTDVTGQPYYPITDNTTPSLLYVLANSGDTDASFYYDTSYHPLSSPLYVNPSPDAGSTNFASWAIAQTHPILAQGCSDIVIQFAADLNGNGRVDTIRADGTDADEAIRWYDVYDTATINWTSQTGIAQPQVAVTNGTAFVFRMDDDESFADAGGTLGTTGTAHSYWPYMIRIRYRLHDTRGRLESNDGTNPVSGRWFERIIDVPRP